MKKTKKRKANEDRIILVPETMKTVKTMLTQDALDFCARDPRNGYPIHEPSAYFHLVSMGLLTNELTREILATDKKRLYGQAIHMLAVVSDAEYDVVHQKALSRKECPLIPLFFFLDMNRAETEFFSKDFMEEMLGSSIEGPNGSEEVHFIRKSEWSDDQEDILSKFDSIKGRTGIYSHYIHLVDDADADRILSEK